MDKIYYQHMPAVEDQAKSGQPSVLANWPMAYACTPAIDLLDFPIMRYTMDAAFDALDQWVRKGIPAPHADRIAVNNGGTPQAAFMTDRFGNTVGGVRSAYLDVPTATYYANSPGPQVCNNLGRSVPFRSTGPAWSRCTAIRETTPPDCPA